MPFDAKCPECGATFKLLDKERGQRFQCEGCDHVFVPGKAAKAAKDIDEPVPVEKSAVTSERSSKAASEHWNSKKQDSDNPVKKGGSRRIGKPTSGGGINIITVGVIAFFVVSAAGLGIWVAVQDRPADPLGPGQQPFRPGMHDVIEIVPGPNPGVVQRPVRPQMEPKDLDSDILLAWLANRPGPHGETGDKNAAMAELARRKEPRAIGPLVGQLTQFFERGPAEAALRAYGPAAEKEVLASLNHPDGGARESARKLLKEFNTTQDLLLTQSLQDLKAHDFNVQWTALAWLGDQVPFPARAVEVAQAQERFLVAKDGRLREHAMKGLLRWGSKANTPAVVKMLEMHLKEGLPSDTTKRGLEALGKWKDPRGASAILLYLPNFFIGNEAARALEQLGPDAAKEVVGMMNNPNQGIHSRVRTLLKNYGASDEMLIAQCLDDFRARDAAQRRLAVEWLEKMKPNDKKRGEVAKALAPLLKDRDGWTQDAAFRAMKLWLDREAVPGILAVLEGNAGFGRDRSRRAQAMEMLASLKDERAVEPLARKLSSAPERSAASKALKDMGSMVELELLRFVSIGDKNARAEVCNILGAIGTEKSLATLGTLSVGKNTDPVVRAAKAALEAISKRANPG